MKKRINELDYVRVIAVSAILLCHFLEFSGANVGLGRYLGGTGNTVFFLVSALLYGYKYNADTQPLSEVRVDTKWFAKARLVKLGASVWPFLIIVTVLYLIFGIQVSWIKLGLNYLFLGYLGKLPGITHLWFLTVLLACYAEFILLLRYKPNKEWFPWVFLVLMCGILVGAELLGIPGLAFGYMGFFGFVFMKGRWFYEKSKAINIWQALIILAVNAACAWWCMNGLFEQSRIIYYLLTDICGFSVLALLIRFLAQNSNAAITYISGISFEIYIVHMNLCAGPFVKLTALPYPHVINFMIVVIVTVLLAFGLHWIASRIDKPLGRVFGLKKA